MSKSISKRITRSQFEKMADFMEKYPQLFHGILGKDFEKDYKDKLWRELADILNAEHDGPKRSALKWRKCFKDYKFYVKRKYLTYLADSSNLSPLTYLDVRYLAMMGYVVDIEGMDFSNSDIQTFMIQEINEDLVTDVALTTECEKQKFYHAPDIITLLQKDANSSPNGESDDTLNKEKSSKKDESNNKETLNNRRLSDNEEPPHIEESPYIEVASYIEESSYNEKSPTKKLPSKKSATKTGACGKISKNATAEALQAIAKELNVKNKLTKRKIELEQEKLILEKRKIEAFELIAKRLHRK